MAKVKITHDGIDGDDAKTPPLREPVPDGKYAALIVRAEPGGTTDQPPLAKVVVAFQILYAINDDGEVDEGMAGRNVFQNYVLEKDGNRPQLSDQRRFELRMLLDACEAPFDDGGFDTDDLLQKTVFINTRSKDSGRKDDYGRSIVFTNVTRVDTAEEVDDGDVI